MTIAEDARVITGGVDTHAGAHVAAALDRLGGLPGVREFPATAAGYAGLPDWLAGSGPSPWPASRAPAATARAWPGTWPRPASGSSRQSGPAGRTAAGRASPIRWMRSARRGPRCPAGPRARRGAGTARWRRSGR